MNDKTPLPEEKLEISLSKILRLVWTGVKHPFTGIIIAALIAIFFFALTKKTKEPVYAISPLEMVAQTVYGEQELKILWANKEVQNITSMKVAIWNNGSQFIDKNDISSTDPIRISPLNPPSKIDILAVRVLKTSRANLEFDTSIELDPNRTESVVINIKGDDALEKFDGGLFHILFSNAQADTYAWEVDGRIKGVAKGFQPKDWDKVYRKRSYTYPWSLVVAFLLIAVAIIYSVYTVRQARKRRRRVRRRWLLYFVGYMLWYPIYTFVLEYLYSLAPPWLVP